MNLFTIIAYLQTFYSKSGDYESGEVAMKV